MLWGCCYFFVMLFGEVKELFGGVKTLVLCCDVIVIFCTGCFYIVEFKHSFDADARMAGIRHTS